jgi:hypothetical protein
MAATNRMKIGMGQSVAANLPRFRLVSPPQKFFTI